MTAPSCASTSDDSVTAGKRLYMTVTPHIFGDTARRMLLADDMKRRCAAPKIQFRNVGRQGPART